MLFCGDRNPCFLYSSGQPGCSWNYEVGSLATTFLLLKCTEVWFLESKWVLLCLKGRVMAPHSTWGAVPIHMVALGLCVSQGSLRFADTNAPGTSTPLQAHCQDLPNLSLLWIFRLLIKTRNIWECPKRDVAFIGEKLAFSSEAETKFCCYRQQKKLVKLERA